MMPAPPAAYAVRMATINNSRVTPVIDRALGYFSLVVSLSNRVFCVDCRERTPGAIWSE